MKSINTTSRSFSIATTFLLGILCSASLLAQTATPAAPKTPRDVTVYVPHVLDLALTPGKMNNSYGVNGETYSITVAPVKMSPNETVHFSLVADDTGLQQQYPFYSADGTHFVKYEEMNFCRGPQDAKMTWTPTYQKNILDLSQKNILLTVSDTYHQPNSDGSYPGSLLPPAPYDDFDHYASAQADLLSYNTEGNAHVAFDIFLWRGAADDSGYYVPIIVHVKVPVIITQN